MSKTWKILTLVLLIMVLAQGAGLLYLWQSGQETQAKQAAAAITASAPTAKPAASHPRQTVSPPPVVRPQSLAASPENPAANFAANPAANPAAAQSAPSAAPSASSGAVPYLQRATQPIPGVGQPLSNRAQNPNAFRAERARLVQQKIRELTANGRQPLPMELYPILQELAEIQGPNNTGGVNIQALRDNLKVADRMQKLAEELQAEIKKPQSQQDMAKIKAIQESILQAQSSLRMDLMMGVAQQQAAPPPVQQQPVGQ